MTRLDELLGYGAALGRGDVVPAFGDVLIYLGFGDHKQLPPVFDKPLYQAIVNKINQCAKVGETAYQALDRYFVLTQPVRQDAAGTPRAPCPVYLYMRVPEFVGSRASHKPCVSRKFEF